MNGDGRLLLKSTYQPVKREGKRIVCSDDLRDRKQGLAWLK